LGIVGLALGLLVAPVGATTVIDFSTGNAGYGGIVSLFSDGNLSGAGIPVGTVTIVGAPQNNSTYGVSGPANSSYGGFVGSLNFSTGGLAGTNVIGIVGSIVGLGLTTTELLLTCTISSYSSPNASYGLVAAVGFDCMSFMLPRASRCTSAIWGAQRYMIGSEPSAARSGAPP